MQSALVDTGVWYAMFDGRVPHAGEATRIADDLVAFRLVLPWPTVYETLRTRFVRNRIALQQFEHYLKKPQILLFDDARYRDAALELTFQSSLHNRRPLSMVDCLMRLILDDVNVRISYLATFNRPDFIDVCHRRRIAIT